VISASGMQDKGRRRARQTTARYVAVACLLVTGAACSDSASSDADTSSVDEARTEDSLLQWKEQARAICEGIEPETEALEAQFAGGTSSPEEAVASLDAAIPLVERYVAAQIAIPIPTTQSDDVERMYELLELQPLRAANLRQAAAASPPDQAAFNAEATTLNEETEELNLLADRLGVEVCIAG